MNKGEEQVEEIPRVCIWVVCVYSVGPNLHFFETIESGRVTNRNLNHKLGWTQLETELSGLTRSVIGEKVTKVLPRNQMWGHMDDVECREERVLATLLGSSWDPNFVTREIVVAQDATWRLLFWKKFSSRIFFECLYPFIFFINKKIKNEIQTPRELFFSSKKT